MIVRDSATYEEAVSELRRVYDEKVDADRDAIKVLMDAESTDDEREDARRRYETSIAKYNGALRMVAHVFYKTTWAVEYDLRKKETVIDG